MSAQGPAVLALDMGATKLASGIGRGDGQMSRLAHAQTHADQGAQAVLRRALDLARGVYEAELAAGGSVQAVGVSTMGYTFDTHVELATNVPGWQQLRIPEALGATFPGLPVVIGNDVHVAAQAELAWGSLRGVDDAVYMNLGSGISAGIVCGGRFVRGANGAAGEVGYSLFRGQPEELMAADGVAPFERWFGGAGAGRRLTAAGLPGSVAEAVARRDDPAAAAFIDDLWTGIAVMAANLCCALNPSVLSLGGGYVRAEAGVVAQITALLERAVPYPPAVVRAAFGADASLRGAVAIALQQLGGRR